MGPGERSSSSRILSDPPGFSADCDLQEWRRRVGRWVDIVKTAQDNGTDRHVQTIYNIFGRALFERALPPDQQTMVDEAQAKGTIDYLQTSDPVATVRDIVDTVAVDPPIAMVTRLISSFQKVTSCRRSKNEDLRVFVSRFRGLAATHLLHAIASSSSQIGEVLAVTLLNNANLDEGTLIIATSVLITLAEAREKEVAHNDSMEVSNPMIDGIHSISLKLSSLEKERDIPADENARKVFTENFRSMSIDYIKKIVPLIQDLKDQTVSKSSASTVSSTFLSDQRHITLNLDDAVQVLRSITQAPSSMSANKLSAKDIDALVNRKVNALLSSHKISTKQASSGKSNNDRARQDNRNDKSGGSRKRKRDDTASDSSNERCFDCGEDDHRRGSTACQKPSYLTLMIRKRREDRQGGSSYGGENLDSKKFFRKRSGDDSGKQV